MAAESSGTEGGRVYAQCHGEVCARGLISEHVLSIPQPDASRNNEVAISNAFRGEAVPKIGPFRVYSHYAHKLTVVIAVGNDIGFSHKYVHAQSDDGHEYFVCMPISWTPGHKDIVEKVSKAVGKKLCCHGGGFVMLISGMLMVNGLSCDFGQADHEIARTAFEKAMNTTQASPVRDIRA